MGESNSYFGSKNAIYQKLINLIPRHGSYIEAFAGSAAVGRHLRPAAHRAFYEPDPDQAVWLTKNLTGDCYVYCEDVLPTLPTWLATPAFIFIDPPYPISDRRDPRPRYKHELSDDQHHELLRMVLDPDITAQVMVCGFPWGMYDQAFGLADGVWHRHDFKVVLRGGRMGRECVWVNYDARDIELHDYRYFGANKKVRQDMRRLVKRTINKIKRLDRHRQQAVFDALSEYRYPPSTAGVPALYRDGLPFDPRAQAESPSAAASALSSITK